MLVVVVMSRSLVMGLSMGVWDRDSSGRLALFPCIFLCLRL